MAVETSFGHWLQRRRKALDLTQEELAQRVGCAAETLRKIEADVRKPSRQMAERLAEALGIPESNRTAFIRAARAELAVDRFTPATQDIPQVTLVPAEALPSGTVTFLFTEIEGSTRLWELYPVAMREALARHNRILHEVVKEFGGVIFKITGNGVCAAFTRAGAALESALNGQRTLNAETWETIQSLRVRMALHTGSANAGDNEYVGRPLNRAARLLEAAHGGQILLSRATQELVCDELETEVELRDLGEHQLRDLIHPEHIFQATVPVLPIEFPPLITLDVHPNNLPMQPTPLIDRDLDVTNVRELILQPETRLVTLVGPGGVGKTRLALQVAVELLDVYPNGVYFVSLAPLRELNMVTPTIAQALGINDSRERPLTEFIREHLRTKRLLLLLDNFEPVVAAAPLISELLAAAPGLSVLVTSRASLHLRGEKEFPVLPLDLPGKKDVVSPTALSQFAAVQLFVERAQDINPNLVFTDNSLQAVAEICMRLDGLPLAIELAAVRMKLFSPEALLVRLQQRLALLIGGPRDLPARQQTLRATIDWSYDLLAPAEKVLFQRLAVFAGGCTLAAATAICNSKGNPHLNVLDVLFTLVDKSLLRQTETVDKEPRFEMLETIREYAAEQLEAQGETSTIEHLHVDFFLKLAEEAELKLTGLEQRSWLDWLEADHQNLRVALGRVLKWGEAEMALRLSAALWQFWELRGFVEEGRNWLNRALAIPTRYSSQLLQTARATALYRAGFLANYQGDHTRAEKLSEESLKLFHELGDTRGVSWARYTLGMTRQFQFDHDQANILLEESLAGFRERGDARGLSWTIHNLGLVAVEQGDNTRAARLLEESLALFRELGDMRNVAISLGNLGYLAQELGYYEEAEERFTSALELLQEAGDKGTAIVGCVLNLGELAQARRDITRAKVLLRKGIRLSQDMGAKTHLAFGLVLLAWVAIAEGNHERAVHLLSAAEAQHDIMKAQIGPADRIMYERHLATLKSQLNPARFASAWAAGQAMSLEQTVAYALDETTTLLK